MAVDAAAQIGNGHKDDDAAEKAPKGKRILRELLGDDSGSDEESESGSEGGDDVDVDEEDETSSSGSDEDEEEDEEEEEQNVYGKSGLLSRWSTKQSAAESKKDGIPTEQNPAPARELRDRLSTFLPQMRQANAELEHGNVDRLDDVDDGHEGQYIEMNLGLGVLSERKNGEEGLRWVAESGTESESESESADGGDGGEGEGEGQEDVLRKLKGEKVSTANNGGKGKIEEVG